MKVMVVGSGGREHALAWKLAQSEDVSEVVLAPGNPGIALEAKVICSGISAANFIGIEEYCQKERIGFVVVGPDQALADGIVDHLERAKISVFGPTKAAAQLESSKAFSKEIMKAISIPTAKFEIFTSFADAEKFLSAVSWGDGWVIKADGLALGKGVVVCESREEALGTAKSFLEENAMGAAGAKIVVEERLLGREASCFSLCDGERAITLGFACDYKRIFDGDKGPNTGGMGAFSPADWMPQGTQERVESEIVNPLLAEMKRRGIPFKGILFTGLMITKAGPKVIEFNARFGDPETQALLPLIEEELLPWFRAASEGRLSSLPALGPKKKNLHAVHVVMAAAGYPGANGQEVKKGDVIRVPLELLPKENESERLVKLFFAGVARQSGGREMITAGGRVLGITAMAESREEARRKAYGLIDTISFSGAQRRSDVGLPL